MRVLVQMFRKKSLKTLRKKEFSLIPNDLDGRTCNTTYLRKCKKIQELLDLNKNGQKTYSFILLLTFIYVYSFISMKLRIKRANFVSRS